MTDKLSDIVVSIATQIFFTSQNIVLSHHLCSCSNAVSSIIVFLSLSPDASVDLTLRCAQQYVFRSSHSWHGLAIFSADVQCQNDF